MCSFWSSESEAEPLSRVAEMVHGSRISEITSIIIIVISRSSGSQVTNHHGHMTTTPTAVPDIWNLKLEAELGKVLGFKQKSPKAFKMFQTSLKLRFSVNAAAKPEFYLFTCRVFPHVVIFVLCGQQNSSPVALPECL